MTDHPPTPARAGHPKFTASKGTGRASKVYWIWIALTALLATLTMAHSLRRSYAMAGAHELLAHGAAQIKFEAAVGHLVFEELLFGDRADEVDQIWIHLDRAKDIALSMQTSPTEGEGQAPAELRSVMDEIILRLDLLRGMARERMVAHMEEPGVVHGDPHFDALFGDLIDHCERAEGLIWEVADAELAGFRADQHALIAICMLLSTMGVLSLWRFERRQARATRELEENQTRLQDALRGADLGSWEWGLENDRLLVNPRWSEMLGLESTSSPLHFTRRVELIHPEDRAEVQQQLERHLEGRVATYEAKYRMSHSSGGWIRVLDRGRVLQRDGAGRPLRVCGTLLDITEDWEAARRQRHLEKQVMQAQKLEGLGVLTEGIAHDFGNLLMPIMTGADLARSELPEDSPVREYLREIVEAADLASGLVHKMLAYADNAQTLPMPIDLHELIDSLSKPFEIAISRKANVKIELAPDLPVLQGDPTQLRQVLLNLATNASEALEGGMGTITIETGLRRFDRESLDEQEIAPRLSPATALAAGDYVFIAVSDDGVGMDLETQQRIYDPFFSTKFTGRGLGMAETLGIVSGHGGFITIESELGRGTTIRVFLPLTDAENEAPAPEDHREEGAVAESASAAQSRDPSDSE